MATKTKLQDKFKVIPNLSLKGKDIQIRLRNRSLILSQPNMGMYSLDERITEASRMHRTDLINEARKTNENIESLKKQLDADRKPK